jgi:hypothetical protein
MNKLLCAALLAALATPALAETTPRSMRVDARSATAIYQEGQVYKINTQLRRVTLINIHRTLINRPTSKLWHIPAAGPHGEQIPRD